MPSKQSSIGHAMLAGACAALMLACKETAILHLFALTAAALVFKAWNLRGTELHQSFSPRTTAGGVRHVSGIDRHSVHLVRQKLEIPRRAIARGPECPRARGGSGSRATLLVFRPTPHRRLVRWTAGSPLPASDFSLPFRKRDASPYQFLAYYGLLVAAIYSLIPYKTPWLALNLWLPLALLAGMAVESLWLWTAEQFGKRAAIPAFCILALLQEC